MKTITLSPNVKLGLEISAKQTSYLNTTIVDLFVFGKLEKLIIINNLESKKCIVSLTFFVERNLPIFYFSSEN